MYISLCSKIGSLASTFIYSIFKQEYCTVEFDRNEANALYTLYLTKNLLDFPCACPVFHLAFETIFLAVFGNAVFETAIASAENHVLAGNTLLFDF
jgi:hypothetical protein